MNLAGLPRRTRRGCPSPGLVVDNFEWAWGYEKRFGLFSVDYTTQTRVWNDTGHLCAEVARTNTLAALTQQS